MVRKLLELKFWGTRGSCPRFNKGDNLQHLSQHTPCVEVSAAASSLVIDAGTAFDLVARQHFAAYPQRPLPLLLSHFHWDHVMGLFLIYDLYVQGLRIDVWSPFRDAESFLWRIFQEPFCPIERKVLQKVFKFRTLRDNDEFDGWRITSLPLPHQGETYGYRVAHGEKSVFYASDFEFDRAQTEIYKGCRQTDLLIGDAFHLAADKKQIGAIGHSSAVEAATFAKNLEARQLALFHYSPKYGDEPLESLLREALEVFPNSFLSSDSQIIDI